MLYTFTYFIFMAWNLIWSREKKKPEYDCVTDDALFLYRVQTRVFIVLAMIF